MLINLYRIIFTMFNIDNTILKTVYNVFLVFKSVAFSYENIFCYSKQIFISGNSLKPPFYMTN